MAASEASTATTALSPVRTLAPERPTYLLLVLRGLEFLVIEEIRAKLQVDYLEICSIDADDKLRHVDVMQGVAGVGRILLQTSSPVEEVRGLLGVQAALAFLAKSDNVISDDAKQGLDQLVKMTMEADWKPAMQLWAEHMRLIRPDRFKDTDATTSPSFRGSCVRDGRHAFKSVEVAAEIGGAVAEKFGWKVDLTQCDLEVVCLVFHTHMIVGLSLADTTKIQFRNRMANEDRSIMADSKYVSTLRPSTTYHMLRLAGYKKGDILLDSMCGVGTIPIWCAQVTENEIFALGGELDSLPVTKAGQNAQTKPRNVDIMQWDSTRLPLRNESVDKVIIDLPFGVRCGNARQHSKIYPKVFKELYRVMRPGSRAVLLTSLKKTFVHSLQAAPSFELTHTYEVNIGGLLSAIYILEKPAVPASTPAAKPQE
ncbi:hypothetical protein Poli38472_003812 [Pythium oligandrum]|uniref:THUMP domain-containing protein n=1 Tax=Pythium oligandrum TaxID=41045 RepID=A0A8K1FNN1_PYTOL|nr:hypothetical protein Poli38472_003812 [Pythium oligandrum]|eukprot:TMW66047.1 hypothetical protein Poli38472_003812 [Pythium oligandrum]